MLLNCIGNTTEGLTDAQREHTRGHLNVSSVYLTRGETYVALGVVFRQGQPWFLVCEEDDAQYPTLHFNGFFEVTDARVPPGWSMSTQGGNFKAFALLPESWASNPRFMEPLVEGDPGAVAAFQDLARSLETWHQV